MYPVPAAGRTQVYCCESDRFETFTWADVFSQSDFASYDGGLMFDESMSKPGLYSFMLGLAMEKAINEGTMDSAQIADRFAFDDVDKMKNFLSVLPASMREYLSDAIHLHAVGGNHENPDRVYRTDSSGAAAPARHADGAQSRFGPSANNAASKKIKQALEMGLKKHFSSARLTNPSEPSQAARSFAKPLTAVGIDAATATAAMLHSLHATIAEKVEEGTATEEEIAAAPVEHLEEAYVQSSAGSGGFLGVALDAVLPQAMRAAQSGGVFDETAISQGIETNRAAIKQGVAGYKAANPNPNPHTAAATRRQDGSPMDLLCFRPFRQYTMGTGALPPKPHLTVHR